MDIVASLSAVGTRFCAPAYPHLDYDFSDVRASDGVAELTLTARDGSRARLKLNLPSSGQLQPWLYARPSDALDWVEQLVTWTDEEVFTLGLGDSRARLIEGGESYVVAEVYGWRRSDQDEHARLLSSAGPFGWFGNVYGDDAGS